MAWPQKLPALLAIACAIGACGPHEDDGSRPKHPLLSTMAADTKSASSATGGDGTKPLGPEASPITFERMARYPEPGWHIPRAIAHSPDGKLVTFLQSEADSEVMALFAFDRATRKTELLVRGSDVLKETKPISREEELRRERQRQRIEGVTSYRWAKKSPVMVIPLGGDVFLRGADGKIARLTETPAPEIDPQPCDTGERVAFVRGSELVVVDVATKKETALTRGAPEGVTRGQSDFNGQEEFDEQSGFWWSPKCDKIAYLEVDERAVETVPVVGYREGKPDLMMQRYPVTGGKNPVVRAGIIDLATKKTTWVHRAKDDAAERYLGRFTWSDDGRALWLQSLSRDQKTLELVRVDAATGTATPVITEQSPTWVEFAPMRLLDKQPRLLWTSVTGGHHHLEVRDAATGAKASALTSGAWDVESIAGVDEERGQALFVATKESPLERHLYSVPLGGGEPKRLTTEKGYHDPHLDREGRGWVDVHSAADRTPRAIVHGTDGATIGELPTPLDPDLPALKIRTPEPVTVKGPGGVTLHGALLKPRDLVPGRRYPVVVMVYGGPGVQSVLDMWSARLLWQHLADRGFVVFQLDNRGSSGRGPEFEAPIYRKMGVPELEDQLAGAEWLGNQPFVDKNRLAIYGHSYGGFMAALAMLKAPGSFKVGIAGSPVTDFRTYDTGYTERYMETPAKNPEGYAGTDLTKLAPNLKGKLFILHALMDENVHFQNTAILIDALTAAGKKFDLMVFPGERHGYRSPAAKQYATRRVVDYLVENL